MMATDVQQRLRSIYGNVRRVRRWLVLRTVLEVAVICLGIFMGYIGLYSYLDHRFHLAMPARVGALAVLAIIVAGMAYRLMRQLLPHLSCVHAANYIDQRANLEQQLVAAVEYREGREDYPYSRSLADQLVLQVDAQTRGMVFEHVLPRWHVYALSLVTALALAAASVVLVDHYQFFARYVSRLVTPLAPIEPLPATTLEALTDDLVVALGNDTEVAAVIRGRVPREGTLVLERKPATADEAAEPSRRPLLATAEEGTGITLRDRLSRLEQGDYAYHFEANEAVSPVKTVRVVPEPAVTKIEAQVVRDGNAPDETNPWQDVMAAPLEVIRGSHVTLRVTTDQPLDEAAATDPAGAQHPAAVEGNRFTVAFRPEEEGFVRFHVRAATQLESDGLHPLQILFKKDAPPRFELLSPEGDLKTTVVASVPVAFRVTDDFGLERARLSVEFPEGPPLHVDAVVPAGAREAVVEHTLELEDHTLNEGDTILVYASAQDVDAGVRPAYGETVSEVYYIEIRPQRIAWYQSPPSLPDQAPQGLGQGLERMQNILAYTRAMLKKAWSVAAGAYDDQEAARRMDALVEDAVYSHDELKKIRDHFDARLSLEDKLAINGVLDNFRRAEAALRGHRAQPAVEELKTAYAALRRLVKDQFGDQSPGQSPPPKTPEKLDINERLHLARLDKEQIDWELKRLADNLIALEQEQQALQERFGRFLERARDRGGVRQETTDAWSRTESGPPSGGQGGATPVDAGGVSQEGLLPASSGSGGSGTPAEPSPDTGSQPEPKTGAQGTRPDAAKEATPAEQLRMLQAAQHDMRARVMRLRETLDRAASASEALEQAQGDGQGEGQGGGSGQRAGIQQAQAALRQAEEAMGAAGEALVRAATSSAKGFGDAADDAMAAMTSAAEALAEASALMEKALDLEEGERLARELERRARALGHAADSLDPNLSPEDRERMRQLLEEARQYLAMAGASPPQQGANAPAAPATPPTGPTGSGGSGAGRLGRGSNAYEESTSDGEYARTLAQEFYSRAIEARKQHGTLPRQEAGDADYRPRENAFFERAARRETQDGAR